MRLISNAPLIKRNATLARYVFTGGVVVMFGALALNIFALFNSATTDPNMLFYIFGVFIVGYSMSTIGGSLNGRWNRKTHEAINDALRGMDDKWTMYHYRLGAAHVVAGPPGVFVLTPKYNAGAIVYDHEKKRWATPGQRRGLFAPRADSLGNPVEEAEYEAEALVKFLKKHKVELGAEPIPVAVFMHPKAEIQYEVEPPVTVLHIKQLKDFLRKQPKNKAVNLEALRALEEKLQVKPERD